MIRAIKRLKNNKACGLDNILNEFLKASCIKLIRVFVKLFNLVLLTGKMPSDWSIGIIKPIYKNKGSPDDPNNYRGITILSCFGKLFTNVINNRLNVFIESTKLLGEEQAGFRTGYSTTDHLFVLYGIVDILLSKKKRLHCAFLDYEKAFDKVDRAFLWQKLLNTGVNGKILRVIINMYANAKSCVQANGEISEFFTSHVGVRQGENLSPILFALFLNDMKEYLAPDMHGLPTVARMRESANVEDHDLSVFLKLFVLLYADDTVIFSESASGLQNGLTAIKRYCDEWKLKLNASKCKIIIFSRGKVRNIPDFFIGNN